VVGGYAEMLNDSGVHSNDDASSSPPLHLIREDAFDFATRRPGRHPETIEYSEDNIHRRQEADVLFESIIQLSSTVEQTDASGFADSSSSTTSSHDDEDDEDDDCEEGDYLYDDEHDLISEVNRNIYNARSNDRAAAPLGTGSGSFPRLSFLDPSLLNEVVQNTPQLQRDCDPTSSFIDSSSSQEDEDDEDEDDGAYVDHHFVNDEDGVPLLAADLSSSFPRPAAADYYLPGGTTDVAISRLFSERSSNAVFSTAPWLIRDHFAFSDSDGYDSEQDSSTSPARSDTMIARRHHLPITRTPPSSSIDPPATAVCQQENCRNRAAKACCNKNCGRCCFLSGSYTCRRHSYS
jgi:hypothetical protein